MKIITNKQLSIIHHRRKKKYASNENQITKKKKNTSHFRHQFISPSHQHQFISPLISSTAHASKLRGENDKWWRKREKNNKRNKTLSCETLASSVLGVHTSFSHVTLVSQGAPLRLKHFAALKSPHHCSWTYFQSFFSHFLILSFHLFSHMDFVYYFLSLFLLIFIVVSTDKRFTDYHTQTQTAAIVDNLFTFKFIFLGLEIRRSDSPHTPLGKRTCLYPHCFQNRTFKLNSKFVSRSQSRIDTDERKLTLSPPSPDPHWGTPKIPTWSNPAVDNLWFFPPCFFFLSFLILQTQSYGIQISTHLTHTKKHSLTHMSITLLQRKTKKTKNKKKKEHVYRNNFSSS